MLNRFFSLQVNRKLSSFQNDSRRQTMSYVLFQCFENEREHPESCIEVLLDDICDVNLEERGEKLLRRALHKAVKNDQLVNDHFFLCR